MSHATAVSPDCQNVVKHPWICSSQCIRDQCDRARSLLLPLYTNSRSVSSKAPGVITTSLTFWFGLSTLWVHEKKQSRDLVHHDIREEGYSLTPRVCYPLINAQQNSLQTHKADPTWGIYFLGSPISLGSTRFINKLRHKLSMLFSQILSLMKGKSKEAPIRLWTGLTYREGQNLHAIEVIWKEGTLEASSLQICDISACIVIYYILCSKMDLRWLVPEHKNRNESL